MPVEGKKLFLLLLSVYSVSNVHVGHDIGDDEDHCQDEEDGEGYGEDVAGKLAARPQSSTAVVPASDRLLDVALGEAVDGVVSEDGGWPRQLAQDALADLNPAQHLFIGH